MKERCKEGHLYTRDDKGHARCLPCDRARYRKKHPYNKQTRLALAAALAPTMRSQPARTLKRLVSLVDKDGKVTDVITVKAYQEGLMERLGVEFDVGDGVRPQRTACSHCGKAFTANSQGVVALVCLDGCDRACAGCKVEVTLKSAREAAKEGRKPLCRRCADLNRPKVTHCKRGHEFTPENTLFSEKTNQRFCRACKRGRMRKHRATRAKERVAA